MKTISKLLTNLIVTPRCLSSIKKRLINTPTVDNKKNLWEITTTKYRITIFLLGIYSKYLENLKNVFSYTLSDDGEIYRSLDKKKRDMFIYLYRKLMVDVVTFCNDEGVDKSNLYEFDMEYMEQNVIRLFLSMLFNFDLTIYKKSKNYRNSAVNFVKKLELDCEVEGFIDRIILSMQIEIINEIDFFYDSNTTNADMLNIPIVGALEFGKDLRLLHDELNKIGLKKQAIRTVKRVFKHLLDGGYGQIYSILQKDINQIDWKKYIEIAYKKGNDLVKSDHALYSMLDNSWYTKTSCDFVSKQIYCDDVCDVLEDTLEGTLNAVSLFFLAQGKLAYDLKAYYRNGTFKSIDKCKALIECSGLYDCIYEGVLMIYHPYGRINKELNEITDINEFEYFVKALLSNSDNEVKSDIETIINRRISNSSEFILLWKNKNFIDCYTILQRNKITDRFIIGYKLYIIEQKKRIIHESSYNALQTDYETAYYYKTIMGWYYRAKYISPIKERFTFLFMAFQEKWASLKARHLDPMEFLGCPSSQA